MKYNLIFSPQSIADLERLKKSEPKTFKKAAIILQELSEHPTTGTGKPEKLIGDRAGQWSRRLSRKHRLVYEIEGNTIQVFILSAYGHYSDK